MVGAMNIRKIKTKSLNEQVRDSLYEYIRSMDLNKNNQLPSEDILAEQLGVSITTVRNALNTLAQENLIFRKQGKGTFVNKEVLAIKIQLNSAPEFGQLIEESGYDSEVELVSHTIAPAGEELAEKLEISPEDSVVRVEKIFYADGKPAIYCIDNYPEKIMLEPLKESDYEKPVFQMLLEKAKRKVLRDTADVFTSITSEDEQLKKAFKADKPKALLTCHSINYDQDNRAILQVKEYYDTDLIKFSILRKKDIHY
jgi:GntR family transcriptional regulator